MTLSSVQIVSLLIDIGPSATSVIIIFLFLSNVFMIFERLSCVCRNDHPGDNDDSSVPSLLQSSSADSSVSEDYITKLEDALSRIEKLEADLATANARIVVLDSENSDLKAEVATLKAEVTTLQAEVTTLEITNADLQFENVRLKADVEELKGWKILTTKREILDDYHSVLVEKYKAEYPNTLAKCTGNRLWSLTRYIKKYGGEAKILDEERRMKRKFKAKLSLCFIEPFIEAIDTIRENRNDRNHAKYDGYKRLAIAEMGVDLTTSAKRIAVSARKKEQFEITAETLSLITQTVKVTGGTPPSSPQAPAEE